MKKPALSDEDFDLFRESVGDVKRIVDDRADTGRPLPSAVPEQLRRDEQRVRDEMLADRYDPDHFTLADGISFHRPGVQHHVLRKLRRGHYSIGSELDLHGMTSREARLALVEFLNTARRAHQHCVRIIHGKGLRSSNKGPVLKPKVAKWLTQFDDVLAYCTARPIDGGTGAIYVLLKK
jgi:DNA-nicking Smr family endonuclease